MIHMKSVQQFDQIICCGNFFMVAVLIGVGGRSVYVIQLPLIHETLRATFAKWGPFLKPTLCFSPAFPSLPSPLFPATFSPGVP